MKAAKIIYNLRHVFWPTNMALSIWGKAGYGKSSVVKAAWAEENEARRQAMAKEQGVPVSKIPPIVFNWIDQRLSQIQSIDLKGFLAPVIQEGKSTYLVPDWLPRDRDWQGVIFFDEWNQADRAVQAAFYQLMLDRACGDYKLPDGARIVCAGNNASDKGVHHQMASPLLNRCLHVEMDFDFPQWKDWAYNHGMHSHVIAFLAFRNDLISTFNSASKEKAFASPRTWEFFSTIYSQILALGNSPYKEAELLEGAVGRGPTSDFLAFVKIVADCPVRVEQIFGAEDYKITWPDNDMSLMFGLSASVLHYLTEEKKKNGKLTVRDWKCVFRFLGKLGSTHSDQKVGIWMDFKKILGTPPKECQVEFVKMFQSVKDLIPTS